VIGAIFSVAFVTQVLRISIPYVLAALGGSVTERSGVVDLALEAKLLFGAFAAAAVGHATDNETAAVVAGIAAGMCVAGVQIGIALGLGADQVIVGVGLNLLALGGTRFLLQLFYGETANSPPAPSFGGALLLNPLAWLALVAAIGVPIALRRTRWGLRLRAAGDRPDSLIAVGVSPTRARLAAALVGGALAGAGGAQLSLSVGGFLADMSSGRGYIALAMVILAGWRPGLAAIACVGVAFTEAINIQLQVTGSLIPRDLAPLLPYVMTLVVLLVAGNKHRRPPASLGQ
jgi:simple sugar transport system permease protein